MHALIASKEAPIVAILTIRGLDDPLKSRLRLEAARRGCSMEETVRQILRQALMPPDLQAGGLAGRIHGCFAEAGSFDLELPGRSLPRPAPALDDPSS